MPSAEAATVEVEVTVQPPKMEARIGFDFETHRMGPNKVLPPAVCTSYVVHDLQGGQPPFSQIVSKFNEPELVAALETAFLDPGCETFLKIAHNAAFDLGVAAKNYPHLFPAIFKEVSEGRVHCTKVREKLLNLADTGDLEWENLPDGGRGKVGYSLTDLLKRYLPGSPVLQRLYREKSASDTWRVNFDVLERLPVDQWPEDARVYSLDDSEGVHSIWVMQENRRNKMIAEKGVDPFRVLTFRVAVDFCLMLCTDRGMCVDAAEKASIEAMLERELNSDRLALLLQHNILRPAQPARPHGKGAKAHVEGCKKKWKDENGAVHECGCPVKMTAGVPASINETILREYITKLAESNPEVEVKRTPPSATFPEGQLSFDAEFLEKNAHLDPVLMEYQHRQELQKLVSTELPRMNWEGKTTSVVHPCFDVLKRTGRTSSFSSDAYPSFNCQNVDPRARGMIVPRPGFLLVSIDFGAMELVTLGQQCLRLFGRSVMADKLRAGIDPHAFLGAQIAFQTNDAFRSCCMEDGFTDYDSIYKAFVALKKEPDGSEAKTFYVLYRTLAKPTGLGYPGGLAAKTMVAYAKATYGLDIDLDTAKNLQRVWKEVIDEAQPYLDWVKTQIDPHNPAKIIRDKATGEEKKISQHAYYSPMGMYRAGCDYCATANGFALQTPGAEGALLAFFNVTRACFDKSLGSILWGEYHNPVFVPTAFIHDEILAEVKEDEYMQQRLDAATKIMVDSFRVVCPDIPIKAQPVLMRRWNKSAEPVFNSTGQLVPWEPKEQ